MNSNDLALLTILDAVDIALSENDDSKTLEKNPESPKKPVADVPVLAPDQIAQKDRPSTCGNLPNIELVDKSLTETGKGNSIFNRLYELAARTDLSKTEKIERADFEKSFGKATARQLNALGVASVSHNHELMTINFNHPIEFGDKHGKIQIGSDEKNTLKSSDGKSVPGISFDINLNGGEAVLQNIKGMTGTDGMFSMPVDKIEMHAKSNGFMDALISTGLSETKVCAFPDGKLYH